MPENQLLQNNLFHQYQTLRFQSSDRNWSCSLPANCSPAWLFVHIM